MDLKVEKIRIGAEVAIRGKRPMKGFFFVVPTSYPVPDADVLLRLLNEFDSYMPFERAKKIFLINKNQISYLKLPRNAATRDWEGEPKRKIRILLSTGQEIAGTISVDLPVERQRVLDFLNLNTLFFLMKCPKEVYLVNKQHLHGVSPMDLK
ncbi:MAG: hypothetical protein C5B54_05660 [Acidobacteria bacterium]|nr:MAG: hypothetical protein C5B54_05660 [Acidobacteriota bacterium]